MCISKRQKRKWRRTLSWPWFFHWALRKPPARNSHKSESLKAFQTQLLWRLGAQISPDKSHPRTAFLLHSNKFTFSPTSRHSHPHSPRSLKMCSKPKFIFSWNSAQVKLFIYQPLTSERAVTIAQVISSVRSSNSHPDLLLIHPPHPTTHFFRSHRSSITTLDFHFLSH